MPKNQGQTVQTGERPQSNGHTHAHGQTDGHTCTHTDADKHIISPATSSIKIGS